MLYLLGRSVISVLDAFATSSHVPIQALDAQGKVALFTDEQPPKKASKKKFHSPQPAQPTRHLSR